MKESTKAPHGLNKEKTQGKTLRLMEEFQELQSLLYAEKKHALLVVLQGMDSSGKDGTIRKVFGVIDPGGINVNTFKVPSKLEFSHDFLWRAHAVCPAKGMIQVFNRSHYEDLLWPTVHRTIDRKLIGKRYDHINNFEEMLQDEGTRVVKFFLNVSREEQARRFDDRVVDPKKRWKYNKNDLAESKLWDRYMEVYERILDRSTVKWKVVPADDKWYRNYVVTKRIVEELRSLKMKYPVLED